MVKLNLVTRATTDRLLEGVPGDRGTIRAVNALVVVLQVAAHVGFDGIIQLKEGIMNIIDL